MARVDAANAMTHAERPWTSAGSILPFPRAVTPPGLGFAKPLAPAGLIATAAALAGAFHEPLLAEIVAALAAAGYVREISRARAAEEALRESERRLALLTEECRLQTAAATAANCAKNEFLANMNHELRTPLNAIIGFAEVMQAQAFGRLGSQKYVEYCGHILEGGRYLLNSLSDILDMSRLQAERLHLDEREFDLAGAIAETIELFGAGASAKGLELSADVDKSLRCLGDCRALTRALGIFVSNSLKFTAEGGRVRVKARRIGRSCHIFVEDNGRGIERGVIGKLGHPFEQPGAVVENGMKGSGLGLAIARSLIALHGGTLRIRSRLGIGTVVLARIPIVVD